MSLLDHLPKPFKNNKDEVQSEVVPPAVLIVGDDMSTAQDVARMLGTNGYEVTTASEVETAVTCMENGNCDLIICDFKTPETDVRQLVRVAHIRRGKKSLPPIVLLWDEPNDELVADELAVSDVVRKPVDLGALLKVVGGLTKKPEQGK